MTDEKALQFFRFQAHPLLVHLYMEAQLEVPDEFDNKIEGPRLVAALRAQGFATQFNGKPTNNSREKL